MTLSEYPLSDKHNSRAIGHRYRRYFTLKQQQLSMIACLFSCGLSPGNISVQNVDEGSYDMYYYYYWDLSIRKNRYR